VSSGLVFWEGIGRLVNWVIIPIQKKGYSATTISLSLASLEKCMPSALKKCLEIFELAGFDVLGVALQTEFSLSKKFSVLTAACY